MPEQQASDRNRRKTEMEEMAESLGMSVEELLKKCLAEWLDSPCTIEGCTHGAEGDSDQEAEEGEECNTAKIRRLLRLADVVK